MRATVLGRACATSRPACRRRLPSSTPWGSATRCDARPWPMPMRRATGASTRNWLMRIDEILFWNKDHTVRNRPDPQLDLPPPRFNDDPTNLANAFTRRGLVKHFWNGNGSEGQPLDQRRPIRKLI